MRNQKEARYAKDLWTKHTKYALKSKKKYKNFWELKKISECWEVPAKKFIVDIYRLPSRHIFSSSRVETN